MKRMGYILMLLFYAVLSGMDGELEVRPAAEELLESNPNQNVTTVLHVTNKSSGTHEFMTDVDLPENWKLITREFPFELTTNETDLKLLSFYVPQGTPAGDYTITYRIRARKYPSLSGYYTFPVHIRTHRQVSMTALQVPDQVIAGEKINLMLLVLNQSNIADSFQIRSSQSLDYPVVSRPSDFSLDPGASKQILVEIQTDSDLLYRSNSYTTFSLISKINQSEAASEKISFPVISRVEGPEDAYHRMPITVTAAYVTQRIESKSVTGFQGDLYGAGYLDQQSVHHLKFHARGPDAYQKALTVYAERDEYVAEYNHKRFTAAIGDRMFSLSQLTQSWSYGRGAELGIRLGSKWAVGMYHQKNRWFTIQNVSTAGYLQYQANTATVLRANFVESEHRNSTGRIFSLSGKSSWRSSRMDLEYAFARNQQKIQQSANVELSGFHEKASYSVRWIYADPDFAGYFRDTQFLSSSVSLSPLRNIGFRFLYRIERQNFNLDTTRFEAPLSEYFQGGLTTSFLNRYKTSLDYVSRSRKDRLNSLFHYGEHSVRLRLYADIGMFTLSASAEGGRTENHLYSRNAAMDRYTASVQYTPGNRQSYRGFLNYDSSIRYAGDRQRVVTAGFQVRYAVSRKLELMLNLQNNHSPEDYYYDRNQSELFLKYILPNQHAVQLRGRHTILRNSMNRRDMAFVAEYKASIGIPVSRKPNTCVVSGRFYDAVSLKPIPDLIVRINGSTAVTDKKGHFVFRNLRKKTYYLNVDKGSMGLNRVTAQRTPLEIRTVEGSEGLFFEIGVVDGSNLSGQVLLQADPDSRGSSENGHILGGGSSFLPDSVSCVSSDQGLENILVEMRSHGEIIRRLTDAKGNFEFEELRPGRWTVQFYPQNLPLYHQLEQELFEVVLEPGDQKILNACVIPKKRRIKFMQEGGTLFQETIR